MKRKFVELTAFRAFADKQKGDFLKKAQNEILRDPKSGDIVPGLGGVRKLRVANEQKGKSGSYRILFLDVATEGICYLLLAYPKSEQENISADEKKSIRALVSKLKGE